MRRIRHTASLGLAAAALLAAACDDAPDAADARGWYAAHGTEMRSLSEGLREAVAEIPHLDVHPDEIPCRAEPEPCTSDRLHALTAQNDAIERFRDHTLPALVRDHGLLGIVVKYAPRRAASSAERETDRRWGYDAANLLGASGDAPPSFTNPGAVAAERGIAVDDRRLGWGLHWVQARQESVSAVEILWHVDHGSTRIVARAVAPL
jgi:hypothetical protein